MIACVVGNEQIVLVYSLIFFFSSWFSFVYAVILRQGLTGASLVGLELSIHNLT